ncbi:baseplate J/gp47 family protein, partial [Patescibacteria group bacterium]|nr:baseplate J/gp47 family protein [Patescibacteria group bacterium]
PSSSESPFGFRRQGMGVKPISPSPKTGEGELSPEPSIQPVRSTDVAQLSETRKIKKITLGKFLKPFFGRLSLLLKKTGQKKGLWLVGMVMFLVLILGGGFAAWWYLPRVDLVLQVKPYLVEKTFTVVLDRAVQEVDQEELVLPAGVVSLTLRRESSLATTGTKTVGDKAVGQVVIYNRTATEKTIDQGVSLIGPDNLNFYTNEEVVVLAEETGEDYTRIPGKAVVGVTAVEFGSEGNLASGAEFEVGKYSITDVVAKNEEAFAGGTSREIRVVAEADLDELKEGLLSDLQGLVTDELKSEVVEGEVLVSESIVFEVEEETYQPQLNEEAEVVTASLGVTFEALTYQEDVLNQLVEERVASSVPDGYRYQDDKKEIAFELQEVEDGRATFQVKLWANLMPIIPLETIKNDLKGKDMVSVSMYLSNLGNGVAGYLEPVFWPKFFPESVRRFPRQIDRIQIDIQVE